MQVTVLLFGKLIEAAGTGMLIIENIQDTDGLLQYLNEKYPRLKEFPFITAVEKDVITENTKLENNYTIALLPPYAGG